jgi:hypothetical protein
MLWWFEKSYSAFDFLLFLAGALTMFCTVFYVSVQLSDFDRVQANMERFLEPISNAIQEFSDTLFDVVWR